VVDVFLKKFYASTKLGDYTMARTEGQLLEKTSWKAVREEAAKRNMPAWLLAEELALHEQNGDLVLLKPAKGSR